MTMPISDIFKLDLRGHDYIDARGLSPDVVRHYNHTCSECQRNAMLPVVQRIVNSWSKN
jgi:hypothetical protein